MDQEMQAKADIEFQADVQKGLKSEAFEQLEQIKNLLDQSVKKMLSVKTEVEQLPGREIEIILRIKAIL